MLLESVILAPLGVRVGPLFVAGLFFLIGLGVRSQSKSNMSQPWLFYFSCVLMIGVSIYSAVFAHFWRVELTDDSLSLRTIYGIRVVDWTSIASVGERNAPYGRFLVYIVIRLRDGSEIKTRNFHFSFSRQLRLAIQRRLEISRA